MKSISKILILSSLLVLLLLPGCQNGKNSGKSINVSGKTGWSYNNPKKGFFNVNTDYYGKCPKGMVYIPVATTVRGQNNDMLSIAKNNAKKRVASAAFYMDEYEVTNLEWREYVQWLQGVYKSNPAVIVRALPDESVWRKELAYNEPYVREYYVSPAYNDYPVVGVSWEQATEYCKWRTDRLNELELIAAGVIPYIPLEMVGLRIQEMPDSAKNYIFTTKYARDYVYFVNANYEEFETEDGETLDYQPAFKKFDMNKDGEILQDEWKYALEGALYDNECRLPTEVEWEYAAYGLDSDEGIYEQTNMYPWQGTQMRSFEEKKEKERGKFYANFLRGRGDPIGVQLNGTLTMPVYSFQPNSFGLYNMAGNVNEWVKDVFRANVANVDEINSYRGNEFESDSLYAEEILTKHFAYLDPAMRDSMRSVLIAERGITKTGGDYRDFKDGDTQSSLNNDSSLIYKDITPIEQANVISNTARVYKGGGWNDRAIWLNPSQRRWLDERQCRNDIGFRCVMSTVGGFEQTREYESK
jgi:gliding motility-associated lipoprotein GldJ